MENPTKEMIKRARSNAILSQAKAAELLYTTVRTWQNWEYGINAMPPAMYELFMLKTGQYRIEVDDDAIVVLPIGIDVV